MALNWVQLDPHNSQRPLMLPGRQFPVGLASTMAANVLRVQVNEQ